jgi:hypothetical protein
MLHLRHGLTHIVPGKRRHRGQRIKVDLHSLLLEFLANIVSPRPWNDGASITLGRSIGISCVTKMPRVVVTVSFCIR